METLARVCSGSRPLTIDHVVTFGARTALAAPVLPVLVAAPAAALATHVHYTDTHPQSYADGLVLASNTLAEEQVFGARAAFLSQGVISV